MTDYRLINKLDYAEAVEFLGEAKTPIAGLRGKRAHKAFCRYALSSKDAIFIVATNKNRIVGFSITIINWKIFWKTFFLKNIPLFFEMIFVRLIQKIKIDKNRNNLKPNQEIDRFLTQKKLDRSWKDSSPLIAKVLYVAVKDSYRKQGIGKALYDYRNQILKKKGIKRLDSKINSRNIAPIKLAYNEGRMIIREDSGMLFTSLDFE